MLEDVSPVSPVGLKKKLTTEACSPEAWIHVFSVGKSSPFMALIHVSELIIICPELWKIDENCP